LQKQLIEKQSEYNGKSVYFQKIAQTILEIENKKDSLEKINNALPDSVAFAPLVYFLQTKGAETGLILQTITFSQIPVSSVDIQQTALPDTGGLREVKEIGLTVSMLGNYQGLKNFLSALEKSSRIFEVNTISFASQSSAARASNQQNQSQIYNFALSLKTHTY